MSFRATYGALLNARGIEEVAEPVMPTVDSVLVDGIIDPTAVNRVAPRMDQTGFAEDTQMVRK